jgi:flagellar hook-associated protein 3 FlgL
MRISSGQFHLNALNAILDQQAGLLKTQNQVATQRRVINPSDDPVAANLIENLQQQIGLSERWLENANVAESHASQEEVALSSARNVVMRVKDLLLQGANGTYSAQEREALATEMETRLEELVSLANTQVNGQEYLFGGFTTGTPPVSRDAAGQFQYNGDQGQRLVDVGSGVQVAMSDPGFSVFFDVLAGNGDFTTAASSTNSGSGVISPGTVFDRSAYVPDDYTVQFSLVAGQLNYEVRDGSNALVQGPAAFQDGAAIKFNGIEVTIDGLPNAGDSFAVSRSRRQDLFTSVQQAIDALRSPTGTDAEKALFRDQVDDALDNLERGMERLDQIQARVGARLNIIENQRQVNGDFVLTATTALSNARDVDMAEAISNLAQQQLGLEAAQRSFARIQNLSLFNFL